MQQTKLSIVISVFNEAEALPYFYEDIMTHLEQLNITYELIFINDGSTDNSYDLLDGFSKINSHVRVISFSRNFGHEAAMLAGIDISNSEVIICMDSDLQHPPNLIGAMWAEYEKGFHIVNMVRKDRKDGGFQKKLFSKLFYGILNKMTKIKLEPNASDFFLISSKISNILKDDYREQTRFLRGLVQFVGFPKARLEFIAPQRIAGESKYSFIKLLFFSFSAITSLTKAPLLLGIYTGFLFAFLSVIVGMYSFVMRFLDQPVGGYTTIVILISAMFSIQFFVLGIMANYIGNIFDEVKKRPHYIVMSDSKEKEQNKK